MYRSSDVRKPQKQNHSEGGTDLVNEKILQLRPLTISRPPSLQHASSEFSPITSPKREAAEYPAGERSAAKRRKLVWNDMDRQTIEAYREFLAKEIDCFIGDDLESEIDSFETLKFTSTNTTWSALEKATFFYSLDRNGRHDLLRLSQDVGTKSSPEIAQYLKILQKNERERWLLPRVSLLEFADFPSAIEVDGLLENTLDRVADVLGQDDARNSRRRAQAQFGPLGILDADNIGELSQEDGVDLEDLRDSRGSLSFASNLLDLPRMLELSSQVFMNSRFSDENWSLLDPYASSPSITQEAFIDLSNLLFSITERLVSSAVFCASSRIRAATDKAAERAVKSFDALAAIEITNMPVNSHNFWAKSARRCRLKIVDGSSISKSKKQKGIRYRALERILSGFGSKDVEGGDLESDSSECSSSTSGSNEDSISGSEEESEIQDRFPSEIAEHRTAELIDKRRKKLEENKISNILGIFTNEDCSPLDRNQENQEDRTGETKSNRRRKGPENAVNWYDQLVYKPEWETYQQPVGSVSFEETDRLRASNHEAHNASQGDKAKKANPHSIMDLDALVRERLENYSDNSSEDASSEDSPEEDDEEPALTARRNSQTSGGEEASDMDETSSDSSEEG